MRIAALGTESMIRDLSFVLDWSEFDLFFPADMAEMETLLEYDGIDLIVLDSARADVDRLCRYIRLVGVMPVVLIVDDEPAGWKYVNSLEVDSYVHRGANRAELVARLKAALRRFGSGPGEILTKN